MAPLQSHRYRDVLRRDGKMVVDTVSEQPTTKTKTKTKTKSKNKGKESQESRRSFPSHAGHVLACEELAILGEDFCHWASRPFQLGRRPMAIDAELLQPVSDMHTWQPMHSFLILLSLVYCVLVVRRVVKVDGVGLEKQTGHGSKIS